MAYVGARATSLPPLRPHSREEIAAAAVVAPGSRRPKLADGGGSRVWTQKPPRSRGPRVEELFRSLEVQDHCSPSGGSRLLRSTPSGRRPSSGSRNGTPTPREQSVEGRPPTGAVGGGGGEAPLRTESRSRRQPSHLRGIKAVYLGEGHGRASSEDLDRVLNAACERPSVHIEDQVKRDVAKIRTGEDAIQFFTRYGTDSTVNVKLLYCNRLEETDGVQVGPYDLIVVPKEKTEPEHFTVSASGVVHFRPGEMSECVPLAEWMQHTLMYRVLTSMTFFRLFPHRKSLYQWRSNARHAAYCRRRLRFSRRCFLAKPPFLAPLMQSRRVIGEVEDMQLFNIPDRACQLTEFCEMQAAACLSPVDGLQRHLEQTHDALVRALEGLSEAVNQAASLPDSPVARPGAVGRGRGKSMVQERKDSKENQRRMRIAKEDDGMIGDCVQLVAYMFQAALAMLFHHAAGDLRHRVDVEPGEQLRKLFTVSADLKDGAVALNPSPNEFEEVFNRIWRDALSAADAVPNLVLAQPLMVHASPAGEAMRSIRDVLEEDRTWRLATVAVTQRLGGQLQEVHDYMQAELYGPFDRVRCFGEEWSEVAFNAQVHSLNGLTEDMARMRKLQEELGKCRAQRSHGCILMDARGLRDSLAPIPERALSAMKQALVSLAQSKTAMASKRFEAATRAVDDRPSSAFAFQTYVEVYHTVVQEQNSLDELYSEVQELYLLLRQYGVKVPMDDRVQLDGLLAKEKHFTHKAMMDARLFIDRRKEAAARHTVTVTVEEPIMETEPVDLLASEGFSECGGDEN